MNIISNQKKLIWYENNCECQKHYECSIKITTNMKNIVNIEKK